MTSHVQSANVHVDDLLRLTVAASRLLAVLGDLPQFKGASVGMSEWIALTMLRGAGGINNKQLAAKLGVSRQRAHQVVRALEKAQLVEIRTSSSDSRENVLRMTPEGARQLENVNFALASVIEAGLGRKIGVVARTQRGLTRLTKVLKAAKSVKLREIVPLQPEAQHHASTGSDADLANNMKTRACNQA